MATAQAQAKRTAAQLLAAVKELPSAELREFQLLLTAWQEANNHGAMDSTGAAEEPVLVARIRQNSGLRVAEQRRLNRLRRKSQAETLTKAEQKELQALWRRVEEMNVTRLLALTQLARLRGTDVKTLMGQLGLPENLHAF